MKQMAPLRLSGVSKYVNECGTFFEVETGLAYVERSIPFQKGS